MIIESFLEPFADEIANFRQPVMTIGGCNHGQCIGTEIAWTNNALAGYGY